MRDDEALRLTLANADLEVYFRHIEERTMHRLNYDSYKKDGIYGTFTFENELSPFCVTLSHAYYNNGTYQPIVMPRADPYPCQRGIHRLADGVPFETFEILGIEGHDGLLFHPLNYNRDSKGCTGLGERIVKYDSDKDGDIDLNDDDMITHSRKTFAAWMDRLDGVNIFMLQVS